MFKEISPIVAAFHNSFPPNEEAGRPRVSILSSSAVHTATITVGPRLEGWSFNETKK
jgi:hypothetical protein